MNLGQIVSKLSASQLTEMKNLLSAKESGTLCQCGEVIPQERIELGLEGCVKCAKPTRILRVREGIGGGNSRFHTELILKH